MSKKKQVEIKDDPLQAVTIGEIKTSKYGWIGTILLFSLFIAIIYFLPDLNKLYQSYIGNTTNETITNSTGNTSNEEVSNHTNENETVDNSVFYTFGTDTEVTVDNLNFSAIDLTNNTLSFNIQNTLTNSVNLEQKNLYFVTYNRDKNILNTIVLKGTISTSQSMSFSYNIKSGATYFEVKEILENDYDYINLEVDDNNISKLTCTKDAETISYTFKEDKLNKIEHAINYLKANNDYNEIYAKYNTLYTTYNTLNGVTSSLTTNENSLNYQMIIDYSIVTSSIDYEYYFAKNTTPRIVNFKMQSLLFDCK